MSGDFSIEAWVAQGAYPWNWCPIVTQQKDEKAGYAFSVGPRGQIRLSVAVDGDTSGGGAIGVGIAENKVANPTAAVTQLSLILLYPAEGGRERYAVRAEVYDLVMMFHVVHHDREARRI